MERERERERDRERQSIAEESGMEREIKRQGSLVLKRLRWKNVGGVLGGEVVTLKQR